MVAMAGPCGGGTAWVMGGICCCCCRVFALVASVDSAGSSVALMVGEGGWCGILREGGGGGAGGRSTSCACQREKAGCATQHSNQKVTRAWHRRRCSNVNHRKAQLTCGLGVCDVYCPFGGWLAQVGGDGCCWCCGGGWLDGGHWPFC